MSLLRRLADRILRLFGQGGQPVPREPVSLPPIAVVRNAVFDPKPDGWEDVKSDLIFRDDLLDALEGIDSYSHIIVVFSCHRVPDDAKTQTFVTGDASLPQQGILASRSQLRPNSVGVAVVQLMRRRKNIVRVLGLDAIDGTPIVDIKPYLPAYDSVPEATVPEWVSRAMQDAPNKDTSP
ncbi:MAG: tRNA (N6-threonylcarbamoyladenosine(37)-N6)-methyltransferase TrmO [Chloroflexi bacterium]|nr:tRNA (N6-threonylcarbamoyladenosine(37)-N6)-methyltransferase TrmO [Chloroflexota bacterium]